MTNNKSRLEMITVVDEYGCVVSVEFIHRNEHGDKLTIVREGDKQNKTKTKKKRRRGGPNGFPSFLFFSISQGSRE